MIWLVIKLLIKVSNDSQQNNSETITNENDKERPQERHISPEERQKKDYWWSEINIIV